MRLASLKTGGRDGRLVIVANDTKRAALAEAARTLQEALDGWSVLSPRLHMQAMALEAGEAMETVAFSTGQCMAPLPRAYQWLDGSAYVNHVELVRRSRGAQMPASFWTDPLMYQGGSDSLLGPADPIRVADESWGIDFEAEIAVITDDVPMGVSASAAEKHIKLVMLANDVSLRRLAPGELEKGFGFLQSKPSTAFSPFAVTAEEIGPAWKDSRIDLPVLTFVNGQPFGRPNAARDMVFDFTQLIAHAARTRMLAAGTIIGSGTVSNRGSDGGPGQPIGEGGVGYSCIVEQRAVEALRYGSAKTPFLKFGDRVRIEMPDHNGRSIFGAIDQIVERV